MPYRMIARKGRLISESGAKKRKVLDNRAKKLKADGWRVRIYKVRK